MKRQKRLWFLASIVVMYFALWIVMKLDYKWYGIIIAIIINSIFWVIYESKKEK
ncbi:hypothetical protein C8E03_102476 [Lachnotalea glycerini]|jgi:hypothetical protein|uniref:Uncharacterized protein n=1 Tax=Lachnotalea glycerini TaxID=1763509 RepID=A0A318EQE5_9FIRM|nr:hypothetical protein [Lachnotalea glycerini]PXV93701.1 hypothetical protein C8E03_102476 [Lachnotalea glycerini]